MMYFLIQNQRLAPTDLRRTWFMPEQEGLVIAASNLGISQALEAA
jgi:hypothetical protein